MAIPNDRNTSLKVTEKLYKENLKEDQFKFERLSQPL